MYKNIIRTAFLFATGIFMTACSSGDDDIIDSRTPVTPDTKESVITLTGIISAGSDVTRAVGENGQTVSWKVGDEICVQYKDKDGNYATVKGKITEVQEDKHDAKFEATLINLDAAVTSLDIGLAYPYSNVIARKETSVTNFAIDETKLAKQAGTIAGINEAKLDIAWTESEVPITINWTKATATLNDNADLSNQVCICKFSLKVGTTTPPETWSPLSSTKLEIMLGGSSDATYTITPAHSTDVFYVVMQPVSGQTVSLKATYTSATTGGATELDPEHVSIKDIIAVNPNEGNKAYLVSSANIVSEDELTKVFNSSTKLNKGKFYKQDVKYTTEKYLPVAVIAYVGEVIGYWNKFLALALEDVTNAGVSTASTSAQLAQNWAAGKAIKINSTLYNTIYNSNYDVVKDNAGADVDLQPSTDEGWESSKTRSGTTETGWRVPSVTDFRYVFEGLANVSATNPVGIVDQACRYPANAPQKGTTHYATPDYTLQSAINTACNNTNLRAQFYWTSSVYKGDNNKGWRFHFESNQWHFNSITEMSLLRAVFAY